jgi:hypothetical protein
MEKLLFLVFLSGLAAACSSPAISASALSVFVEGQIISARVVQKDGIKRYLGAISKNGEKVWVEYSKEAFNQAVRVLPETNVCIIYSDATGRTMVTQVTEGACKN